MNAPQLFESIYTRADIQRIADNAGPLVRGTDPSTSREAADCVKPGSRELVYAIRWWVSKQSEPKSAFDIADAIYGQRWQHDTVRTCVSRAGLHAVDSKGRTKGGRPCLRYVLRSA